MANRIQNDYQSHMQADSPDMDMLWAKIEQRIDAKAQPEQPASKRSKISVKRNGIAKYIAAAACLVAVVIGTTALLRSKSNDISTGSESASVSSAAPTAESEDTQEKTNDDATSGQPEKKSDASYATDVAGITNDKKALMPESENPEPNKQVKDDKNQSYLKPNTKNATNPETDKLKDNTKIEEENLSAADEFKELMRSDKYINADMNTRIDLISVLAQRLKNEGRITSYNLISDENLTTVDISLPDNTTLKLEL